MSKIEIIYLKPEEPDTVYLDPKEPIVFEVLEETTTTKINLEPQVKVHIDNKKENCKPEQKTKKKTHRKKHKTHDKQNQTIRCNRYPTRNHRS